MQLPFGDEENLDLDSQGQMSPWDGEHAEGREASHGRAAKRFIFMK